MNPMRKPVKRQPIFPAFLTNVTAYPMMIDCEVGNTVQQVYEMVNARHLTETPLVFEVPTGLK